MLLEFGLNFGLKHAPNFCCQSFGLKSWLSFGLNFGLILVKLVSLVVWGDKLV